MIYLNHLSGPSCIMRSHRLVTDGTHVGYSLCYSITAALHRRDATARRVSSCSEAVIVSSSCLGHQSPAFIKLNF